MIEAKRHKDGAIEFWDGDRMFYDISRSEQAQCGPNYWLRHLRRKPWFTSRVEGQFSEAWVEKGRCK